MCSVCEETGGRVGSKNLNFQANRDKEKKTWKETRQKDKEFKDNWNIFRNQKYELQLHKTEKPFVKEHEIEVKKKIIRSINKQKTPWRVQLVWLCVSMSLYHGLESCHEKLHTFKSTPNEERKHYKTDWFVKWIHSWEQFSVI